MRPTIAMVHGDPLIMGMLSEFLADEGFQPLPCPQSRAVHSMIIEAQPALILLDLELDSPFPRWNLVDQLRADPHTQHIPIIALTTSNPPIEQPESCQYKCEVLREPFDLQTLLDTLKSFLNSQWNFDAEHVCRQGS